MLVRNCAGGIVFHGGRVLLLYNEKNEWVFPKGVIRDGRTAKQTAHERVSIEAGVEAEPIALAGETHYEFYSVKRNRMVRNDIRWYCMRAESDTAIANRESDIFEAGFFDISEALEKLSHNKAKSMLIRAYQIYSDSKPEA